MPLGFREKRVNGTSCCTSGYPGQIIIMHLCFFSDLNNSTVPVTDDNDSYVCVVGKYNIVLPYATVAKMTLHAVDTMI